MNSLESNHPFNRLALLEIDTEILKTINPPEKVSLPALGNAAKEKCKDRRSLPHRWQKIPEHPDRKFANSQTQKSPKQTENRHHHA